MKMEVMKKKDLICLEVGKILTVENGIGILWPYFLAISLGFFVRIQDSAIITVVLKQELSSLKRHSSSTQIHSAKSHKTTV